MHVLFVEPSFPGNQIEFVRALSEVGAAVTGIGELPAEHLPDSVRQYLHGYETVRSVVDEGALLNAVRQIQQRQWVDRMEATVEAHMLPAARVREATGIPGISEHTTFLCRDKPAMKEALRRAGVACAQSIGASTASEVLEFAATVGFPLILKPRSAAGAAGTLRADDAEQLEAAIAAHGLGNSGSGNSVAVEEFIEGHEGFYDTVTINGTVAMEFISHYYPGVLESMRERWISPYLVTTNRLDAPGYEEVREMGAKVIQEFRIGTSATHMEWFFGPKGLKFSEIGCRPPGVGVWDLYSAANDIDLYREWAAGIVHGQTTQAPSRRFAAGMINLRPDSDGRITRYEGLDRIEELYGQWIIDSHLPPPGSRTEPVEAGYMANAWIRMRHSDFDELRRILDDIGRTLRLRTR